MQKVSFWMSIYVCTWVETVFANLEALRESIMLVTTWTCQCALHWIWVDDDQGSIKLDSSVLRRSMKVCTTEKDADDFKSMLYAALKICLTASDADKFPSKSWQFFSRLSKHLCNVPVKLSCKQPTDCTIWVATEFRNLFKTNCCISNVAIFVAWGSSSITNY